MSQAKHIALSYSRHSTYEQCPAKFHAQYIAKDYPQDNDNPHFVKGKKKHSQLENYIKCKNDPTMINMRYDGDVQRATSIVDGMINAGYHVTAETQFAVDKDFKPVSWFDKTVMYRSIADVIAKRDNQMILGDWKTGKVRDYDGKDTGQLHLSAAIGFAHFPEVDEITTPYFFIEHKQTIVRKFTREMYETTLTVPFYDLFDQVNSDTEFAPTKNQYCNWCELKHSCPAW